MPLDWDVLTPLIYDLFYQLCSRPQQNSIQLHCLHIHKESSLFTLLLTFQTWRLSAVRMAEDNLEMGKGSVGQIWDWSKLIGPWLIKTDQTVGLSWGRKQTMDLWELRRKLKRVKYSFYLPSQSLELYILTKQVCMGCMRFCLLVQFVHLRPWELGSCSRVGAEKQVQQTMHWHLN